MAYTDFEFYTDTYYGEVLTAENADKWLSRASDALDAPTFGRLATAFPTVEAHIEKVCKAVCAVAEALYYIDIQRKAAVAQKDTDGTYHGTVSSISSGGESISYASGNAALSVYSAAAADNKAQACLINSIAAQYLANVTDAEGTNLLYAGVM